MSQQRYRSDTVCTECGKVIRAGTTCFCERGGDFCSKGCAQKYAARQKASSSSGSSSSSSSAGSSSLGVGDAAAVAGVGIAAAGAGIGVLAKGAGALFKGTGALLGGLGKGVGSVVNLQTSEFGKTRSAEKEIIAINKMKLSSDPEEYKNQIWELFDKATSKPADLLRDTFVIRAAKKKLIHELDMCKLKNPDLFNSQFAQLYEKLTEKKKLFGFLG